jgi:hypothetical protein
MGGRVLHSVTHMRNDVMGGSDIALSLVIYTLLSHPPGTMGAAF